MGCATLLRRTKNAPASQHSIDTFPLSQEILTPVTWNFAAAQAPRDIKERGQVKRAICPLLKVVRCHPQIVRPQTWDVLDKVLSVLCVNLPLFSNSCAQPTQKRVDIAKRYQKKIPICVEKDQANLSTIKPLQRHRVLRGTLAPAEGRQSFWGTKVDRTCIPHLPCTALSSASTVQWLGHTNSRTGTLALDP